ncbi:MAG: aldo/keto reductase [Candidatus Rokuibacteriota bacterium]
MSRRGDPISRREAIVIGSRAALALGGVVLGARQAPIAFGAPAAPLVTKPIPSSGERIAAVGVGTARRYDVGESGDERAPLREVLRDLPRLGGNVVDTAPSYGAAEAVIGDLVADLGNRQQLFIATKVGRGRAGAAAGIAEMRGSMQRLRTERIDLVQVHNLAGVDEMLPVLREWKRQGRIRYYGVTTSSARQHEPLARLMQRETLDFVQVDYAIDNRAAADRILPLAADRGIAVLTNLPFGRGRVLQAFGAQPVPDWAKENGIATWAQFALKYVVSHPAVTCAIPGTAQHRYLVDNLGAAREPLPDEATRKRMAALIDAA